MRSGKRLSSLSARLPNMHFDLKTKSLAMIDLEVTLHIHLRFFQRTFHPPPPSSPQSAHAVAGMFPCMAPTVLGGLGERSSSPAGPGGARPPNVFGDFVV